MIRSLLILAGLALLCGPLAAQDKEEWPRVMVILEEVVDGREVRNRTVAARIEEVLLEKGFRLVDKRQFENVTARDIALAEGNPTRAKEIGLRYGAELLVVGYAQGDLDNERDLYGIKNYEYVAEGDAKAIITDTGEMIAVSTGSVKKLATGKRSAQTLALQTLGESLASDMYVKVRMKILEESKGSRILTLALLGMDARQLAAFERNLPKEITRIESMRLRFMESDGAVYEISVVGTIDDLRQELSKREDLVIIGATGTRLDVSTKENAERAKGSSTVTSPLEITGLTVENIFPSQVNYYAYNPLATVEIENAAQTEIRNVKVSILIPGYMTLASEQIVPTIGAGAKQSFQLPATLDAKQLLNLSSNSAAQAKVELSYSYNGQIQTRSLVKPVTIYSRNTISWNRGESVGSFVTETDDAVANFARYVVGSLSDQEQLNTKLPRNVVNAMAVWNGIRAHGITYIGDPWKQAEGDVLDVIQYPRETLASRTGDCDDSSVLLVSCLENVGIRTKFLATNDHIFMMFDTELHEKNGYMISQDENDYIVHEGTIWIPLETTMIKRPFLEAWRTGAEEYYKNVAEGSPGSMEVIDTRKAQAAFPPANLSFATKVVATPPAARIASLSSQDLADYEYYQSQVIGAKMANLEADNSPAGRNTAAIFRAKAGEYDAAIALLSGIQTAEAMNTLGNVYLLRNELPQAQEYYQKSLEANDTDGGIYLNFGLARYLSGETEDAVESFQVAISKFDDPDQALTILGLDKIQEALGMRASDKSPRKVSKSELFSLLNKSLKNLPDKKTTTSQAYKVREKYKNQQNRYVFGGRRGADPTQIASIKEFLYWKE